MEPYIFIWLIGWGIGYGASLDVYPSSRLGVMVFGSFFIWPIIVGRLLGKKHV